MQENLGMAGIFYKAWQCFFYWRPYSANRKLSETTKKVRDWTENKYSELF